MTDAIIKNHHLFADDLSAHTMAISRLHKETEQVVKVGFEKVSKDIIEEIRIERTNPTFVSVPRDGILRSSPGCSDQYPLEEKRLCENFVLESLRFKSMNDRHEDIAEVHEKTFEWMLEGEDSYNAPSLENQSTDFVKWLRDGEGIYWINGKAGSGKSTLMRYLYHNPRTRYHLQSWAGGSVLLIAGHFFWNSGTPDQRSQRGLFRSLLFEIFRTQRHLIPTLLPELWQELLPLAEKAREWSTPISKVPLAPYERWALPRLRQVFKAMTKIPKILIKFCFFIDGLDEYEGEGSHIELVDCLQSLAAPSNVKICASSRPWLVFEDAFSKLPSVRLQDLTFDDISYYVADRLGSDLRMKKLCGDEPEEAPKLMEEIVTKAHGVFLWVELVVRSLLSGLGNRDRIFDLQKRLRLLPDELEDLYQAMLLRIEPFYRQQASQIFQLVQAEQEEEDDKGTSNSVERTPLTVTRLAFADIEDAVSMAVESPVALLTDNEITSLCESMDHRLKTRCAGLLETSESKSINDWSKGANRNVSYGLDSRVSYLHRTAKDFLQSSETRSMLKLWNTDIEFDCYTKLLAACIFELKCITLGSSAMWSSILGAMTFAQRAEIRTSVAQPEMLDELDHVATISWTKFRFGGTDGHWSYYIPLSYDNSATSTRRDTFLLYAAQHGLVRFVEYKRSKDPECCTLAVTQALSNYQPPSKKADGNWMTTDAILRDSFYSSMKKVRQNPIGDGDSSEDDLRRNFRDRASYADHQYTVLKRIKRRAQR